MLSSWGVHEVSSFLGMQGKNRVESTRRGCRERGSCKDGSEKFGDIGEEDSRNLEARWGWGGVGVRRNRGKGMCYRVVAKRERGVKVGRSL